MVIRSFFIFLEFGIIYWCGKFLVSVLLNFKIKLEILNFYVYLIMMKNYSGFWIILIVIMVIIDMNEFDC